jgi:type III restriction enzyme
VRFSSALIVETKGCDELAEVKAAAAARWVAAVNADGRFGTWRYAMVRHGPQSWRRGERARRGG